MDPAPAGGAEPPRRPALPVLALGALGVVFGDLGTSGLYAMQAAFRGSAAIGVGHGDVLGLLSLIFWALLLVVSFKYLLVIMRADNRGEGGIMALLALLAPRGLAPSTRRASLITIGLFGSALLYGDGVITPSISVLSAIEGLEVTNPLFARAVVPLTVVVLLLLFFSQHRGTGRIGLVFGPIMLLWFLAIAALGVAGIARYPAVLAAASPVHGYYFLTGHGLTGFLILGVVVLAVTGAEALYADMGHFGAPSIRLAWYALVLPALFLNYFGQGAILLLDPAGTQTNPFFALVPDALRYPMVALATIATIIASQAVIAGAFSLTRQAMQLGYLPRLEVRHTSAQVRGQIYVPAVNWLLMVGCVVLVLAFRASDRLASAYGMAVAGTMATTSALFYFVARDRWGWGRMRAGVLTALFLLIDLAFVVANVFKIIHGAWIPLVIAVVVQVVMATWRKGVARLTAALHPGTIGALMQRLATAPPVRVAGTGVFLSRHPGTLPLAMLRVIDRTNVLQREVVMLVLPEVDIPRVEEGSRGTVERLGEGLFRLTARYGFMETPDVPRVLGWGGAHGIPLEAGRVTYFLGRISIVVTDRPGMTRWRKALFELLWRNAQPEWVHFGIPPAQVMELGEEVEL
jgi:KUP system potassium uptake protein